MWRWNECIETASDHPESVVPLFPGRPRQFQCRSGLVRIITVVGGEIRTAAPARLGYRASSSKSAINDPSQSLAAYICRSVPVRVMMFHRPEWS